MYSEETKQIVKKLMKQLYREKLKGSLLLNVNDNEERAHNYTGISRSTLRKWSQDEETGANKKKTGPTPLLDDFDTSIVVRKVQQMFASKQVVTLRKLKATIQEEAGLQASKTTLWRCLKAKGYAFQKTAGINRRTLCERGDIRKARFIFLRKIKEARDKGYNIVFLDETWVNVNHTKLKEWMNPDAAEARIVPTGRGQRLILLHAVDKIHGFIPECKLLFKSHSTDGRDYHTEMNSVVFENWLKEKLLPTLTDPSVIVFDNASYHTRKDPETSAPTTASRIGEMRQWLETRGIPFPSSGRGSRKKDLMAIINSNKPPQQFVVDNVIREFGHEPLRLPPYHCQFNPIELLWGIVKNYVAANNTEFKLEPMKKLTSEALETVSIQTVLKCFDHAQDIERQYWQKDGLFAAPQVQPFVINTEDSSDDYTSYASSSEDEL